MKKIFILPILLILLSFETGYAQSQVVQVKQQQNSTKSTVTGQIIDAKSGEKLIGALIVIEGTSSGGISDAQGKFSIKNIDKNKETSIEISYVGYKTQIIKVKPTSSQNTLNLPIVKMEVDGIKIKDVNVIGSPTAVIKGDTTVFSAGAYKTNPDATAGDLLAKMPGFERNDDGTVSAQGDKVQRIYVDGKSFFKNDLATALSSLPAGLIDNIEMFDDKSDKSKFTGYDDGTKIKSINITTKNRMGDKPMTLLEASAGYGYKDVYMGSLNYMRFKGDEQISVMAGTNNINIAPIGMGRRGGMRFGGNSGGINTQIGAAVNYSNKLKNEGEIGFSYTFNNSKNSRESYQTSTYFPTEDYENRLYNSSSVSENKSNRHNFSLDYKTNIGKKTQITFRPSGSITSGDNSSISNNNSIIDGDTTTNNRRNISTPFSYSINGELSIMRKFTENSFLTLGVEAGFDKNDNDSYLEGETFYRFLSENNPGDTTQHQKSVDDSDTKQVKVGLDYTQRLSRTSGLNFGYEFGYNVSDNDRKTYIYDELTGTYKDIDEQMSNVFKRNYMTNNLGARYNYKTEMTSITLGAKYQNAQMVSERTFPMPPTKQTPSFNGAVVNADYSYGKRNSGMMFSVSYSGNPSYPSVTQLQDVLNNDNPLQLSSGNPLLKQSFNNNLWLRFRLAATEKNIFLGVYSRVSNTINGVVNNTILYDADSQIDIGGQIYDVVKGAQYTSPTNMNGSWNLGVGGDLSFPLDVIKTKMNVRLGYEYRKQPSMYNNVKYSTTTNGISGNIGFSSNISENVDFTINNRISYSVSDNTQLKDKTKNTSVTDNLRVGFNWIIWKGFFINVDYDMTYRKYSNSNLDRPFTNMLNGAVGKKFGDDKFEIRASVYDALNQNINISQSVNDIYISETISNNLTRYFSLSFTYKFNTMKNMMNKMGGGHGMPGGGYRGGRRTM